MVCAWRSSSGGGRLDSDAEEWLIAHNGEAISPEVLNKIITAGGSVTSDD